ncbi:helix-turn-helix domain-containing protein [Muricauda oceani]|uniref:Helix-turn-helix transcriptional regulator n=1 Tax=Flagellimonas oceani TaxID=2698672 RepID=A0A6G7J158_9FLAO|nr:helix-turn-helix transcriptional regulator [Allomuricauda oceani]MBW8241469.1 helix-turn-helix domain-containing protein [Allomuricauda oceani]QII44535.1 helix-turn-helix transcriptional regulator [Allomuricauda oceani]
MDFRDEERRKKESEYKNRLGRKLKELRLSKDMSQLDLALEADLARTQISRIENGQASPTVLSFLNIVNALNLSKDQVLELMDLA